MNAKEILSEIERVHQERLDEIYIRYHPPETCRECGGMCSPTEQRICLSELDGAF
jgi:hypothetical protein